MAPAPTSMLCLRARPLRGAILPYKPSGMAIDSPVGMALWEFGDVEVSEMANISYPTDLGVARFGRNSCFFLSVDVTGTM
eukprot:998279-Ditylum_brightwellii.AAC.1